MTARGRLLVVDDDPLMLVAIQEFLSDEDLDITLAEDGVQAYELLVANPSAFDAVLLDWVMPKLSGLEVLRRMKQHERLSAIPVIVQTARETKDEFRQGLDAGAYHYLTKPIDDQTLRITVRHAITEFRYQQEVVSTVARLANTMRKMDFGIFRFRTLQDARELAVSLASAYPDPSRVALGLSELMINAIEHGNLGISYREKSRLHQEGTWENEIERRLRSPLYGNRNAQAKFERTSDEVRVTIMDEGEGFDWEEYLEFCPDRAFDSHGRGIAMANHCSFDALVYAGVGNEVCAVVRMCDLEGSSNLTSHSDAA